MPAKTVDVTVEEVFSHTMRPYPSKVGQSEKQQVLFTGNHYVFSVYKSKTQTTTVSLSSSVIESYSKLKPTSQSDSTITYGPYSNVETLKRDPMKIHFENNAPFLTVSDELIISNYITMCVRTFYYTFRVDICNIKWKW